MFLVEAKKYSVEARDERYRKRERERERKKENSQRVYVMREEVERKIMRVCKREIQWECMRKSGVEREICRQVVPIKQKEIERRSRECGNEQLREEIFSCYGDRSRQIGSSDVGRYSWAWYKRDSSYRQVQRQCMLG